MQQKQITNTAKITERFPIPAEGRILAIDPGTKRVGLAICDPLRITVRPVTTIERGSWKSLLAKIEAQILELDAVAVVVGLPLESSGEESPMSAEARSIARKLSLSLKLPIFLQDERVSSYEAKGRLWRSGAGLAETRKRVDAEAAAIILEDFLGLLSSPLPSVEE